LGPISTWIGDVLGISGVVSFLDRQKFLIA
jgi:hypothetical protein